MKKSKLYILGVFLAALLIVASYYIQFFLQIKPCLLCLLQRWVLILIAVLFLLSFLLSSKLPRCTKGLNIINALFSLLGITAASRQLWLEHQPPSMDMTCLPDAHYLITHLPLQTVAKMMILGSSDCGQVNFMFLGLSLAGWSILGFIVCFVLTICIVKRD